MRSTVLQRSRHVECSSAVRGAPASPKDRLEDHEKGEDWHLIALLNGYMSDLTDTTPHRFAAHLCEASFGAPSKSLIVVLESNLGHEHSVEHIEQQGQRAAEELNNLLQWNAEQGRHFSGYSLVGHSLGGLVARVVPVHIDLKPRVFVSLFSPHAGVETFVSATVMPAVLQVTGLDKGAAADVLEKDVEKNILTKLSEGKYADSFMAFEKRVLYGAPSDWLVDFNSAVLTNTRPDKELFKTQEEDEYPLLHLHKFQQTPVECPEPSVRCRVLNAYIRAPINRIAVDWSPYKPGKHSLQDMSLPEQLELTRHLATQLGSSFALPRGAKCSESQTYCAHGLECRQGLCQPRLMSHNDCVEETVNECRYVIGVINDLFKEMTVIVTSSGGGGHLVAAKNLQETLLEEADAHFQDIAMLLSNDRLLKPEARQRAQIALKQVQAGKPAVEMLDLMKSKCTDLGALSFGDSMSEQWNKKQRAGDIEGLKKLVKAQPLTQWIFGSGCRLFMQKVCQGLNLHQLPLTRLYTTQPLLLQSLLEACSNVQIDLWMTDLPTTEAVHFFQPLKSIEKQLASTWKKKFFLHSLPPPHAGNAGQEELERLSGVPRKQIYLEKFMPVNRAFTKPDGLPQPGEMFALKFKAQLPLEEEFLKEIGNPLVLRPEDEVILVMLGSQPTASAVEGYAKESLKLPPVTGTRYVLLACGKPKVKAYAQLYTDMVHLARSNKGKTRLMPFTGQDAKEMLGRAEITITRSGGLTAGELLALRTRKNDTKQMMLHVEPVPSKYATKILAHRLQNNEKDALATASVEAALEGMVPWEAGNARYLMSAVGAKVVMPESFVAALGHENAALPLDVDWNTLLHMRGYGPDAIAFATSSPEGCQAVCQQKLTDLPPDYSIAKDKFGCWRALNTFNGPTLALDVDVAANRHRRFTNGYTCGGKTFMVRKRRSGLGALFFQIDNAAQTIVSECGASIMNCGNFVIAQLP